MLMVLWDRQWNSLSNLGFFFLSQVQVRENAKVSIALAQPQVK